MIIIADSGSTKTDWAICLPGEYRVVCTQGINPFMLNQEEITGIIQQELFPQLPMQKDENALQQVYFYGAGCTPEKQPMVAQALAQGLGLDRQDIEVQSDLLGAARGLLQHNPGVACILGTGSNSCKYDGQRITANVSPLGFILGDEGSGAVLGKKLVGNCLKRQFSPALCQAFEDKFQLTPAQIIQRVYRESFPNRFLASLTPFLSENLLQPEIYQFLVGEFEEFIKRNIMQYNVYNQPVSFVGSIAYYFQEPLQEALRHAHLTVGQIVKSPMEGLIHYHNK